MNVTGNTTGASDVVPGGPSPIRRSASVDVDELTDATDVALQRPVTPGAASITVGPLGDGSLVTLVGDIDGALREQASLVMTEVLSRGGPVVVDLGHVTFIDSSGLAFVLQLHRLSTEDPTQTCTVRNAPALVLDLFEMIGVLGELRLEFSSGDHLPAPPGASTGDDVIDDLAAAPA